jgi:cystathionine beta-lyase/cystathionine gamma-synthase
MSDNTPSSMRPATRVIHAGQAPEPLTGAVMPPIFQTSTYVQPRLGEHTGYEYARVQNPTREALERSVAALEEGTHGLAFASGMAAIECILTTVCSSGDHVVCEENVYGGTMRLMLRVLSRFGIEFDFVDSRDPAAIRAALRPRTRLIFLETPSNPLMRLADLPAAVEVAREAGILLCVDNTFATPVNQRPLAMGADLVVHSATKYLNGHSDVVGGVLALRDDSLAAELAFVRKCSGGIAGPMDSWLVLRGIKTLHVRMRAHNANGMAVARFLEGHPRVGRVHYPGLPSHPQHDLATKQMSGFTGMISLEMDSPARARTLVEGTRLFALAESLGGVESLISVPALMTHASVPEDRRIRMGVTEGLVRLSVGIEDVDDLMEDLDRALRRS